MNALKLVGMSEGAKKRKARQSVVTHRFKPHIKLVWFKCWARDALGRIESEDDRRLKNIYAHARSKYRVGERLAPCRCCRGPALYERCKGQRIAQDVVGEHLRGGCPFCMTCLDRRPFARFIPEDACDGSGVVPAKRAKR